MPIVVAPVDVDSARRCRFQSCQRIANCVAATPVVIVEVVFEAIVVAAVAVLEAETLTTLIAEALI